MIKSLPHKKEQEKNVFCCLIFATEDTKWTVEKGTWIYHFPWLFIHFCLWIEKSSYVNTMKMFMNKRINYQD